MRPILLRLSPLVLVAITAPIAALAAQNEDGRDIVVTAQSADDTRRALEACLARHCPPDEDMRLTLAHADKIRAFEAQRRLTQPWLFA